MGSVAREGERTRPRRANHAPPSPRVSIIIPTLRAVARAPAALRARGWSPVCGFGSTSHATPIPGPTTIVLGQPLSWYAWTTTRFGLLLTRLARAHPAGGTVIERAAVVAAGADFDAVLRWILAH